MDVETVLQIAVAHGGAFDVPARAASAERGVPACVERIGILGGLPQCEIARIVLVGGGIGRVDGVVLVVAGVVDGRAHGVGHFGGGVGHGGLLLMRQLAVMRPGRHIEVHVAGRLAVIAAHHIGVAVIDDALDHIDHIGHMPGRSRFDGRRQHAQIGVGLAELAFVMVGACPPLLACRGGLVKNLVVDVGHIAHESDLIAELEEPTAHDVECYGGTDMADVRRGLHRRATHIHANFAGLDWGKRAYGVRGRIVQLQSCGGFGHLCRDQCARHDGSVEILRFLSVCHSPQA